MSKSSKNWLVVLVLAALVYWVYTSNQTKKLGSVIAPIETDSSEANYMTAD
jgi:hypothetical protein